MMPGKINNSPQQMQIRSRHRMQAETRTHCFLRKPEKSTASSWSFSSPCFLNQFRAPYCIGLPMKTEKKNVINKTKVAP